MAEAEARAAAAAAAAAERAAAEAAAAERAREEEAEAEALEARRAALGKHLAALDQLVEEMGRPAAMRARAKLRDAHEAVAQQPQPQP